MTPKEKAKRIIKKHLKYAHITDDDYVFNGAENYYYNAKKCALITVNEIIQSNPTNENYPILYSNKKYWQEVKREINKINNL